MTWRAPLPRPVPARPCWRHVLGSALVTLVLAAGCTTASSESTVDDLVATITPTVAANLGQRPTRITCARPLEARRGATTNCTVQDGQLYYPLTVTYRSAKQLTVAISPAPTPADQILD